MGVDPNAVTTYKWILGGDRTVTDSKPCPMKSGASVSKKLHEQNIAGLTAQLNAARQREELLSKLVVTQMQLRQSIAMPTAVNRVKPLNLYQTASAAPISPIRVSAQVSPVSTVPMSSFPQISTIGNGSLSPIRVSAPVYSPISTISMSSFPSISPIGTGNKLTWNGCVFNCIAPKNIN